MALSKAYGVRKIVVFDIPNSRVDFALKFATDISATTSRKKLFEDFWIEVMNEMTSVREKYQLGSGVDLAVEASGAEVCTQMALALLKPGGTCELMRPRWPAEVVSNHTIEPQAFKRDLAVH